MTTKEKTEYCPVCDEEIYFDQVVNEWVMAIRTSYWSDYKDDFDYVERAVNFCYLCGKEFSKNETNKSHW